MSQPEPGTPTDGSGPPAVAVAGPGPAADPEIRPTLRPARLVAPALLLASLAGVGSWLLGEAFLHAFRPPSRLVTAMGVTMDLPAFEDRVAADTKNATLAYAIFGGLIGLAAGLAGGLARRSARGALVAAAIGAVAGSAAGALGSAAFLPLYYQRQDQAQEELSRDLMTPLMVHAGIWAAAGAAAGAALAIGLGDRRRIVPIALSGLMGGAMGAFAYEVLGALAFPDGKTTQPIATFWGARLLAYLVVALLINAIAAVGASSRSRRPSKAVAEV